eukprot:205083-Amphidinium_carterae.1
MALLLRDRPREVKYCDDLRTNKKSMIHDKVCPLLFANADSLEALPDSICAKCWGKDQFFLGLRYHVTAVEQTCRPALKEGANVDAAAKAGNQYFYTPIFDAVDERECPPLPQTRVPPKFV